MEIPLDETYIAFGDGSETDQGCFYGLFLIPESAVLFSESILTQTKLKYGVSEDSKLHCRELFAVDARRKSCWSKLSDAEVIQMCGEILGEIEKLKPKYLVGFIPKEHYPKRFRLKGKNGHSDLVHDIDAKWLILRAYQGIAALLDPATIDLPSDPIKTASPKNEPWWRRIVYREDPGLRVSKIYLDREDTKIRWFSKSFQWISVAKDLVIKRPNFDASYLPVVSSSKHQLLEIADLFLYSITRTFAPGREIIFPNFQGEAYIQVIGHATEEIVFGAKID